MTLRTWLPGAPCRVPGGYLVPAGARLPTLRCRDPAQRITLGPGASVAAVSSLGPVELSAGARVEGDLQAGTEVVLACDAEVLGRVLCEGRVVAQDRARVGGPIEAGGDVLLLGSPQVADVAAGGDILVAGAPRTGELRPKGRVVTRSW